jgi:hypothetical protein
MPVLVILTVVACCFMGVGILAFSLSILAAIWKGVEALLNGLVSGVILFVRGSYWTTCALLRARRAVWRWACAVGNEASRRGYAGLYGWGYVLKRRYIASQLRALRRAARTK